MKALKVGRPVSTQTERITSNVVSGMQYASKARVHLKNGMSMLFKMLGHLNSRDLTHTRTLTCPCRKKAFALSSLSCSAKSASNKAPAKSPNFSLQA
jgi:hypothetical protein